MRAWCSANSNPSTRHGCRGDSSGGSRRLGSIHADSDSNGSQRKSLDTLLGYFESSETNSASSLLFSFTPRINRSYTPVCSRTTPGDRCRPRQAGRPGRVSRWLRGNLRALGVDQPQCRWLQRGHQAYRDRPGPIGRQPVARSNARRPVRVLGCRPSCRTTPAVCVYSTVGEHARISGGRPSSIDLQRIASSFDQRARRPRYRLATTRIEICTSKVPLRTKSRKPGGHTQHSWTRRQAAISGTIDDSRRRRVSKGAWCARSKPCRLSGRNAGQRWVASSPPVETRRHGRGAAGRGNALQRPRGSGPR